MDDARESGQAWRKPFAMYDQDTSTWKTWPVSGREDSIELPVIWPHSGMTSGGIAYALAPLGQRITGIDGLRWPYRHGAPAFKTPTSNLASNGGARDPAERIAGGHGPTLDDQVCYLLPRVLPAPGEPFDWGRFADVVRRWERISGQPAPFPPSETGPRGGRRVTAHFCEWLMGLPRGWVTGVRGLNYAEQIRAIGNAVVPLQAYRIYRYLMKESKR